MRVETKWAVEVHMSPRSRVKGAGPEISKEICNLWAAEEERDTHGGKWVLGAWERWGAGCGPRCEAPSLEPFPLMLRRVCRDPLPGAGFSI